MTELLSAIETIKQDHIKLMEGLDKLGKCSIRERLEITTFLVGYLTSHMFLEEHVMRIIDYPLINDHIKHHHDLQEAYISKLREFLQGKDNDLIDYCKALFDHHANTDDAFLMFELDRLKVSIINSNLP